MSRQNKMAAVVATKWRTRCLYTIVVWSLLAQYVNGYDESYTISQLSPKSAIHERLPAGVVLQTSQSENIEFSVDPVAKYDTEETEVENDVENENTKHVIVKRSANPNDRLSRSINIEEIPSSNNNEIDNDLEMHNKRKYYEIHPTKTIDHLTDREDINMMMISSEGFGDRINFRFPGEANRVPKARALIPSGPIVRPTAVQPIFATVTPKEQGRQNTEIQNIITGIVKLLNGNVNVQANSQLLNGRPGRPMASRINNRGPPRISDAPPLPDYDKPLTPPPHSYHPTRTPPPYPFDRPPHIGVNLPEQIVPPMNSHRPGFHRPMPPWQRPRPRPPVRRPPGLPYKPTLPPMPLDLPEFEDGKPEEEVVVSENETSHSENNIHHDDNNKDTVTILNLPEIFGMHEKEEEKPTTTQEPTTSTEQTTTTTTTTTEQTTTSTSTTTTTTTEQPTETTPKPTTTTEKPKTEKPTKPEKDKKKDTVVEKERIKDKQKTEDKQKIDDSKQKTEILSTTESVVNITSNTTTEPIEPSMIQPSITEEPSSSVSIASPTPTEGLISHVSVEIETSTSQENIKTSSINSQPTPTSQGIPYHPYRPRPGIVLDDPDFKPHGSRHRPITREPAVITAVETRPPGYGEIFDVTVSAIQGPGEKGSVHIETVHPLSGHHEHDDIIVSASGDQGFVSIDGKRTYLNLFDTSTPVVGVAPTRVHTTPPQHTTPPPSLGSSIGAPIGTGVAIPADDVQIPPPRRPAHQHPLHRPPPQSFSRPHPTVRIDTCIVGDDSTCDLAQNEKCRTEAGISSCQCRPGYARRSHRDPCRRVVSLIMSLRVDRIYDRKVAWDAKFADKESDPYQQLSYEAVRAIDSAFSMTPFSDDFVSGAVNSIHRGEEGKQVFVNYTILMQETAETLRPPIASDIQKHILGVIRRRSNNVGASALWVDTPAGSVMPLFDLDECASSDLNDCHKLASCTNTWGGFKCHCPEWTLDEGSSGRSCKSCSSSHCNERGQCRYTNSQPTCSCVSGYYGSVCEVDGSVVGVAVGASLAAALVIALTLLALLSWSRKWSREQKAVGMGSPVFSYMASNTMKTPPVGGPPYQVTIEERMRWAQIAEAMAQANHYAVEGAHTMATRPSSAMFGGYPTLPPVPMPRMGLHGGMQTGTLNTVASRANTAASHHNLYGYSNHGMTSESTSSEASSHAQDRADLLVPRPKSRARSMHNQTGIYYDVDYENAPEAIYGTKGIPLSTYTVSRGPPFYRS